LRGGHKHSQASTIACLLFIALSGIYLITAKGFGEITDVEAYYLITESIVERAWVDLAPGAGLTENIFDERWIIHGDDGRIYSQYWLGYPIFQIPWYIAGKYAGQLASGIRPDLAGLANFLPRVAINLAGSFVTAATASLLFLLLMSLGLPPPYATVTTLLYGVATYAWPYAKIGFYEHFMALTMVAALLLVLRFDQRKQSLWYVFAFSFLLAWGTATRPTMAMAWPPILVYLYFTLRCRIAPLTRQWRQYLLTAGAVVLGMAPWLILSLWYNDLRSGSITNPGYSGGYIATTDPLGFLIAVFGNTFSTGRGFFLYSPVALLMFWGIKPLWRRWRAESLLIWALVILFGGFFCSRPGWYTIWPWGPRYLVILAPLVIIALGFALQRLWSRSLSRKLIIALIAVSILVQLLAIAVPYGTYLHYVEDSTGTWRTPIWNPRYFPVLGQIHTLRRVRFDHIPVQALQEDVVTEEVKSNLRHSLDFWFIYAYRLGVPARLWGLLLLILIAVTGFAAWRLWRVIQLGREH